MYMSTRSCVACFRCKTTWKLFLAATQKIILVFYFSENISPKRNVSKNESRYFASPTNEQGLENKNKNNKTQQKNTLLLCATKCREDDGICKRFSITKNRCRESTGKLFRNRKKQMRIALAHPTTWKCTAKALIDWMESKSQMAFGYCFCERLWFTQLTGSKQSQFRFLRFKNRNKNIYSDAFFESGQQLGERDWSWQSFSFQL